MAFDICSHRESFDTFMRGMECESPCAELVWKKPTTTCSNLIHSRVPLFNFVRFNMKNTMTDSEW